MKRQKESRAFWVFLLCMLMLPFLLNSDLAAQDENLEDFVVTEEEPLPDEADSSEKKEAVPQENADEPADDEGVEGDEPVDEAPAEGNEELPALTADPNELLGKVNGLYRAKKYSEVIESLEEHEDVVETSAELAEIYVNSLMNTKKPDWNSVNRAAKILGGLDRKSALADYAQGLYYQNKTKPDLGKAISFFGKAKSAKKPHPDAAMAYYMAIVKKFWMIGLAAIALPIIIIANKIKKKKAAKAALELNLDGEDQGTQVAGEDLQNELQAAIAGDEDVKAEDKAASPDKDVQKADNKEKTQDKTAAKPAKAATPEATPAAPKTGQPAESQPAEPAPVTQPASQPAAQVVPPVNEPEATAPANVAVDPGSAQVGVGGSAPAPASAPATAYYGAPVHESAPPQVPVQPAYSHHHSLTSRRAAEIEQARSMLTPQRRDPVSADPELDAVWSKLCRKALQNKIPAQAKSSYEKEPSRFIPTESPSLTLGRQTDFSSIDPNVSIDLSEEALKDDLIGKLKMLAITDGELRSLLAQKNSKHIPQLIEYVLSKPEPVRLALVTRELGNFQDPAVLDILASLLYNEDHRVALAAIQGLEISRNTAAILHICPFLKSDVPLLAQAARTALANFGAVQILKAFAGLPQHPDARIREAGVFVLSRMKGAQVEQLLVQMLNDDSQEVREKVILAMSYQKNPEYIDPLREFFRIAAGPDKTLARKAIVYLQGFVGKKK